MKLDHLDYWETEKLIMQRYTELRPQKEFLQAVVERLDMEFPDKQYPFAGEVIEYIIRNEE